MEQDPYSELYHIMRTAGQPDGPVGPAHLRQGKVLSVSPLKVDVAGTVQEADRFYISHRLLQGHAEQLDLQCSGVSGSLQISASCPYGAHSSMSVSSGVLAATAAAAQAEPVLKAGDLVLLLTDDDQVFYLMDKVVKAG